VIANDHCARAFAQTLGADAVRLDYFAIKSTAAKAAAFSPGHRLLELALFVALNQQRIPRVAALEPAIP
jgi:hypothetical protein